MGSSCSIEKMQLTDRLDKDIIIVALEKEKYEDPHFLIVSCNNETYFSVMFKHYQPTIMQ